MDYLLGMDFGSQQDYTTHGLIRRHPVQKDLNRPLTPDNLTMQYHLVFLDRYPLGTPYPQLIAHTQRIMADDKIRDNVILIPDATGVGLPIIQQMRMQNLSPMIPIAIHGGNAVSEKQDNFSVPKRDLVSSITMVMQTRRLKVAANIKYKDQLIKEMQNFKLKMTKSGNDTYEALTQSIHDDLVMCVAMPIWYAERFMPDPAEMFGNLKSNQPEKINPFAR